MTIMIDNTLWSDPYGVSDFLMPWDQMLEHIDDIEYDDANLIPYEAPMTSYEYRLPTVDDFDCTNLAAWLWDRLADLVSETDDLSWPEGYPELNHYRDGEDPALLVLVDAVRTVLASHLDVTRAAGIPTGRRRVLEDDGTWGDPF